MYPHELIGKLAVRKQPVKLGGETMDYSYTSEPILILASTESHIVYDYRHGHFMAGRKRMLDCRWIDNNWTDYELLMGLADNNPLLGLAGIGDET